MKQVAALLMLGLVAGCGTEYPLQKACGHIPDLRAQQQCEADVLDAEGNHLLATRIRTFWKIADLKHEILKTSSELHREGKLSDYDYADMTCRLTRDCTKVNITTPEGATDSVILQPGD